MTVMAARDTIAVIDGQDSQYIHVADRGLAFGDGLFESMRYELGHVPLWYAHKARLLADCKYLDIPITKEKLDSGLSKIVARIQSVEPTVSTGVIKLIVTRGQGGAGYEVPSDTSSTICFLFKPRELSGWLQEFVSLLQSTYKLPHNRNLAGIKHLNKLDYILASARAGNIQGRQLLMTDIEGHVVECLHHNIFGIRDDNTLLTPSLDHVGVKGVMRRFVCEHIAPQLGYRVIEKALSLSDLEACDEVFICNAVIGICPVKEIDLHVFEGQKKAFELGALLGECIASL